MNIYFFVQIKNIAPHVINKKLKLVLKKSQIFRLRKNILKGCQLWFVIDDAPELCVVRALDNRHVSPWLSQPRRTPGCSSHGQLSAEGAEVHVVRALLDKGPQPLRPPPQTSHGLIPIDLLLDSTNNNSSNTTLALLLSSDRPVSTQHTNFFSKYLFLIGKVDWKSYWTNLIFCVFFLCDRRFCGASKDAGCLRAGRTPLWCARNAGWKVGWPWTSKARTGRARRPWCGSQRKIGAPSPRSPRCAAPTESSWLSDLGWWANAALSATPTATRSAPWPRPARSSHNQP